MDRPTLLKNRPVPEKMSPVVGIVNVGGWPHLQKNGTQIVSVDPVDYVFFTQDVKQGTDQNKALREKMGVTLVEYWVAGRVDPPVRAYAESQGIKVTEQANDTLITKPKEAPLEEKKPEEGS